MQMESGTQTAFWISVFNFNLHLSQRIFNESIISCAKLNPDYCKIWNFIEILNSQSKKDVLSMLLAVKTEFQKDCNKENKDLSLIFVCIGVFCTYNVV